MKVVEQTKFEGVGNCTQACVASIFELELDEVPDFVNNHKDWYRALELWTIANYMLFPIMMELKDGPPRLMGQSLYGHYLISGQSPRGRRHMCVGKHGRVVHDPHPDETGLIKNEDVIIFAKIME